MHVSTNVYSTVRDLYRIYVWNQSQLIVVVLTKVDGIGIVRPDLSGKFVKYPLRQLFANK